MSASAARCPMTSVHPTSGTSIRPVGRPALPASPLIQTSGSASYPCFYGQWRQSQPAAGTRQHRLGGPGLYADLHPRPHRVLRLVSDPSAWRHHHHQPEHHPDPVPRRQSGLLRSDPSLPTPGNTLTARSGFIFAIPRQCRHHQHGGLRLRRRLWLRPVFGPDGSHLQRQLCL